MIVILIIFAALALAYANGANANFKSSASLFDRCTSGQWAAVAGDPAIAHLLATRFAFPVSATHMLMGGQL